MFKVKVSLLYFLLIVLSVVALSLTVGKGRKEALRLAEQSFEAFPAQFDAYRELRERRLEAFAREVAVPSLASAATAAPDARKASVDEALIAAVTSARRRLGNELTAPEVVMVFDARGAGLAAADRAAWTGGAELADTVLRVKPAGGSGAPADSTYYDVMKLPEHGDTEYIVAVVPLSDSAGAFGGAVLVGQAMSKALVEGEQKLFDRDVTYILDDRAIVSTLDASRHQFMLASAKVADRMRPHLVSNDDLLGVNVPFGRPGGSQLATAGGSLYGARYAQLRVVLATNISRFDGAFESLTTLVPVVGGATFLIGVLLFGVLIRNYTQPLHKIDAGIHEVINGNLDYTFPFDYADDLAASMAQNLNVMMSVVLGKPMPEVAPGAPAGKAGAPNGKGLATPEVALVVAEVAEPGAPELLAEAGDAYFRRVFDEYTRARATTGPSEPQITYVRFVEQLVSQERRVKDAKGCKHVRFRVEARAGAVVLVPLTFA